MLVNWRYKPWCSIFSLTQNYNSYSSYGRDDCREVAWAVVALLEGILFCVIAYSLYVFVYYQFDNMMNNGISNDNEEQKDEQVQVVPTVEMAIVTSSDPSQEQNHTANEVENDKA